MSVLFSGSNQGRFIANGQNIFIPLPSGCDWLKIANETQEYLAPIIVGNTGVAGAFTGTFLGPIIGQAFMIGTELFTIVGASGALTPTGTGAGTGTFNVSTGALTFTGASSFSPIYFIQEPADGNVGVKFFWQSGDATGRGTVEYVNMATSGALNVSQIALGGGFYFINTTNSLPGPLNNGSTGISNISAANPPVVTVGSTANMHTGQTVQLYNMTSNPQLNGLQFTITVLSATTFALTNMTAPSVTGAQTGNFRVIPYEPLFVINPSAPANVNQTPLLLQDPYWYPTTRVITNISQAQQAIVTLAVTQTYTIGQSITLHVPTVTSTAFGMPQLDQLQDVTIINIGQADANGYTNTITINVDTTGFGPFAFPSNTAPGFTPAMVVPIGENTASALFHGQNILADSTINQSGFGLLLVAGALSPAGQSGDIITYIAGKSFNGM
jgi:hypothetical protein